MSITKSVFHQSTRDVTGLILEVYDDVTSGQGGDGGHPLEEEQREKLVYLLMGNTSTNFQMI